MKGDKKNYDITFELIRLPNWDGLYYLIKSKKTQAALDYIEELKQRGEFCDVCAQRAFVAACEEQDEKVLKILFQGQHITEQLLRHNLFLKLVRIKGEASYYRKHIKSKMQKQVLEYYKTYGGDLHSELLLHTVARYAKRDAVEFVFSLCNGFLTKQMLGMLLVSSAEKGNLFACKKLVKQGADPNYNDGQAVLKAAENGYSNVVRFLLKIMDGAVIEKISEDILYLSSRFYHTETVKVVLQSGYKMNIKKAYDRAVDLHSRSIVKLFVEHGFAPDEKGIMLLRDSGLEVLSL